MGKVSKGFFWSAVDQFSVQGVSFILSIIIARLVSPSAYGVVVMVQVFMSFAQLFIDGGFKSALIQKKDRTDEDFYTVFIFNMVVALILYAVMFVAAPFIANFYNEPQLSSLTRVIALSLIFASFSLTQMVKIQATLNFKVQAKARLIATVLSGGVGVACAYKGMEAWALVIQGVLSQLLTSIFLMIFFKWMPRLVFSMESFKRLFSFGSKVLFGNFLTNCFMQVTNLVIVKVYSPAQLAYYNRGFNISQLPSVNIMEVMGRTIYPIFCDLQGNKVELDVAFRKYLRLSCFAILPLLGILCALAEPLIVVLLTDKWVETAPLLSLFCISFATYPFLYICGNYSVALGFAGLNAKASVVKRVVSFVLLLAALPISVTAIAVSLVIGSFFEMLVSLWLVKKSGNISLPTQLSYVKDIVLVTLLSAVASWFVMFLCANIYAQLFLGGIAGIIIFVFCVFLFNMEEKNMLVDVVKKFVGNRKQK